MQFVKCIAHRHGLFDRRVLEFSDRLNIIYGKNGAGKTLLARAMIEAIWGRFSDQHVVGSEVWKSLFLDLCFSLSESGCYRVSNGIDGTWQICFRSDNEDVILFSGSNERAPSIQTDSVALPFEARALREFIGRSDLAAVLASSFIQSPADLPQGFLIDPDVIRKIILSDGTNFYQTYLSLQNLFQGGEECEPPEVRRLSEIKRDLDRKIQIHDIRGSRHEKLIREKNSIQAEIDELKSSLDSLMSQKEILNKIMENLNRVEMLKREFDVIKEEIQREQQKIASIHDMHRELETLFPQFRDIDENDSTTIDMLQQVFNEIRNLNERIDTFFLKRDEKKRTFRKFVVMIVAATAAVIIALLVGSGFRVMKILPFLGTALGVSLALIAGLAGWLIVSLRDREVECFEETKRVLKSRIKGLMDTGKLDLDDIKLTEVYELLLQYVEDYVTYAERKKDLTRLKDSLKDEAYMKEIQNKLDELKREEEKIKDEIHLSIDTLNIVGDMDHETTKIVELIQNIEAEAGLVRDKIETKERICKKIDEEFSQSSGGGDTVSALMEEYGRVDRVLRKWGVNKRSLLLMYRIISEAVERSESKQFARLIDAALDGFHHLTGNQFITRLDEKAVMRIIREPAAALELGTPTAHALYLSIVCALTDFIAAGGNSLPLLIDEPFQFMDDERCSRFRDLVSYVSNKRQVIIFTHQSDKRSWGNFIEL